MSILSTFYIALRAGYRIHSRPIRPRAALSLTFINTTSSFPTCHLPASRILHVLPADRSHSTPSTSILRRQHRAHDAVGEPATQPQKRVLRSGGASARFDASIGACAVAGAMRVCSGRARSPPGKPQSCSAAPSKSVHRLLPSSRACGYQTLVRARSMHAWLLRAPARIATTAHSACVASVRTHGPSLSARAAGRVLRCRDVVARDRRRVAWHGGRKAAPPRARPSQKRTCLGERDHIDRELVGNPLEQRRRARVADDGRMLERGGESLHVAVEAVPM